MFSPYKKTITGLPVRNIDYGSLHKKRNRDVKSSLEPDFIATLDSMCNNSGNISHPTTTKCSSQTEKYLSTISCHGNDDSKVEVNPLQKDLSPIKGCFQCLKCRVNPCNCKLFCGICRTDNDMNQLSVYEKDEQVDLVMGGVINRIDHLIERLGKGKYDKPNLKDIKVTARPEVGIILPCEACAIRSAKRYNHIACQTEPLLLEGEEEEEDLRANEEEEGQKEEVKTLGSPQPKALSRSASINSIKSIELYTETDDDNISVLSSEDETDSVQDYTDDDVPEEVREYQIAAKARHNTETGTTETVHFQMLPYRNLYVWGSRKYTGTLPTRIATKSNYNLNYHIKIFKGLNSDRTDIRMKKLKEIVSSTNRPITSLPAKKRTLDSSKLANIVIVDISRYSRQLKRSSTDLRIPVINMRDGHCNKYWLSERVSDTVLSRSPRLRFAIEMAKSNRCHWKLTAKDLMSNQRPYTYQSLYGGRAYQQFYLAEMKRYVTKPLLSRCLIYYADLFENNTKDGVTSKAYIGCLGNQNSKDSKSTPIVNFEDRLKEHLRSGQKLFDPKIHIFNVALQNPGLALDEPGRLLASKGTSEITKCPMLIFVPLDFGFSSWSKPTTQDHLSALRQSYIDIFCCNSPAGYNV